MACAFEAIDAKEIHPEFDGAFGVSDRGAFMEDDYAGFFQLRDYGAGGVAGRFDDADAFGDDDGGVAVVVWGDEGGEEGEVYGEGRFGKGAAFADFGAQGFGRGLGEGGELARGGVLVMGED